MEINIGRGVLLITILLCILKVSNIITISWLWCFCIIWLPIVIGLGVFVIALLLIVILGIIKCIIE